MWDGFVIISIKFIADNLEYAFKSVNRPNPTTVSHTYRGITYQPKYTVILPDDKCPYGPHLRTKPPI